MENLDPPSPLRPKSRMGKSSVFALRATSSLIRGRWGFAVPFYFVQDCSIHERDGFSTSLFHCQSDWSGHGPAGQFCLLESALSSVTR